MEGTEKHQVTPVPSASAATVPSASAATVPSASPEGKTIIITGATGSMGAVATRQKAREGYRVIMACRNTRKAEELRQQILIEQPEAKLVVMPLELSSSASIRAFAEALQGQTIDALFCNAGIKSHRFMRNAEGIEMDFATNYLGNRLLTNLIVPLMPAGSHIVIMVSLTTKYAHLDLDWAKRDEREFGQLSTYASSKLALMYYAIGLARRHPDLHINVADPGIVDSNMINMGRWYDRLADIFFRPFIKTPEQGVHSALQALKSDLSLQYFVGRKHKAIPSRFLTSPLVEQLWEADPQT